MGRRSRRRYREAAQEADPARVVVQQQMARVNVSDEEWLAFRTEAIRSKRSVATYLGHLVAKELRRIDRRDTGEAAIEQVRRCRALVKRLSQAPPVA